jgi:plasmid stabilization system protein ParE
MFFIEAADEVQIVRVIQGSRNLPRMLRFQKGPHS